MLSSLGNLLLFLNGPRSFNCFVFSRTESTTSQLNIENLSALIQTTSITICFFTLISAFIVSISL